ncbi:sulfite exporter TauE/SafE family protein [Actinoallomurus sp. NPDC052274]|uniref:sulfite exporter TauE/SafE family protein n=1 Tax=Actinoallomurus sp. NPDC052274 TaxID=3155420 RepID=UPI00343F96E8
MLPLALIAGGAVGLALGGLGGGGSMLAVPALIYLLRFSPSQATTASLLIVATTSLIGLLAHARAGRVRWRTGTLFATAGLPAAAAAGAISAHLPGALLSAAFALAAGLAAWRMLAPGPDTVPGTAAGPGKAAAAGSGLGAVTGLLGVGGGFLTVPALVFVLALPMAEAIGTSLLVISVNSLAALIPRAGGTGAIDWSVVGPFTGTAVLGAWKGKRWAEKLSDGTVQKIFAIALLAVAALMFVDALR